MKLIPVTKEHIAEGIAEDCLRCPVALALLAAGSEAPKVFPHETIMRDTFASHLHSEGVRWWIDDFDEWSEDGDTQIRAPQPVTLVLMDDRLDDRLLTLPEWQAEHRP